MIDHPVAPHPSTDIASTIAQHGAPRVLAAALAALFRTPRMRPPPPLAEDLTNHLRWDVGLPPRTQVDRRLAVQPFVPGTGLGPR